MFGSLGMPELIFILVLALLIFGPKRLPQVGRTLGRGLREFRQATNELKRTVETEISAVDTEAPRPTPAPLPAPDPAGAAQTPEAQTPGVQTPEAQTSEVEVAKAEAEPAGEEAAAPVDSSRTD